MKKLFSVVLVLVMFLVVTSVKAMTEDELYKKVTQTITVNGEKYAVEEGIKNQAKAYLNQFEVSSSDADYINARITKLIKILKDEKTVVGSELSASAKQQIRDMVTEIREHTSVNATVTDGALVIYDGNGEVFVEVTRLVKQTGSGVTTTAILASISLVIVAAGALLVGRQVKHTN